MNSLNVSEYGDDDARFLRIPKGGKKSMAKNYDTLLIIKVHHAKGKNMINVGKVNYYNLKDGDWVQVQKNQDFEILNFSNNEMLVQLILDSEENKNEKEKDN